MTTVLQNYAKAINDGFSNHSNLFNQFRCGDVILTSEYEYICDGTKCRYTCTKENCLNNSNTLIKILFSDTLGKILVIINSIINEGVCQYNMFSIEQIFNSIELTEELSIILFPHITKRDEQLEYLKIFRDNIIPIHIWPNKYGMCINADCISADCINTKYITFEIVHRHEVSISGYFKDHTRKLPNPVNLQGIIKVLGLQLLLTKAFIYSVKGKFTTFEALKIPACDQLLQVVTKVNYIVNKLRWQKIQNFAILVSALVKFCDHRTSLRNCIVKAIIIPNKATVLLYYRRYIRQISSFIIKGIKT